MTGLTEKVERLRRIYRGRLNEHRQALKTINLHRQHHPDDQHNLEALQQLAHRLAGSSAMYGFDALAARCKALELALKQGDPDPQRLYLELDRAIGAVIDDCNG